jgi:hypothetical protein
MWSAGNRKLGHFQITVANRDYHHLHHGEISFSLRENVGGCLPHVFNGTVCPTIGLNEASCHCPYQTESASGQTCRDAA